MYRLFFFVLLLCCSSCQENQKEIVVFTNNVMTIDYHLTIGHSLNQNEKIVIQKIVEDVFSEIDTIYNKWNPASEIGKINQAPGNTWIPLSSELNVFLLKINHYVNISNSLFDPTVESLQELWKKKLHEGLKPTQEEIDLIKSSVGWHNIIIKDQHLLKKDGRTQIDLGGIAKGLAVDKMIKKLQEAGFSNIFFEWGGEIKAVGKHPSGRLWRAYISRLENIHPSQAIAYIDLENQALATSGDYFQNWTINISTEKKTYCHILNPQTSSLLELKKGSIASATILATDCVTADALAKVLMLFDNVEEAEKWIKKLEEEDSTLAHWIVTR